MGVSPLFGWPARGHLPKVLRCHVDEAHLH